MPNPAVENALVRMEAPRERVDHLIQRAQIIDDAIARRMKDGVHYGIIPGTKRKALLKPGAEALQELFSLSSCVDSEVIDYPDQHREVRSKCTISAPDGTVIVQRSASCTTYETKYRYRSENTGAVVPREYWKQGADTYKNPEVLGGLDFFPRKVDGEWLVFHQIPVSNQPDNWHTVGSMAEKRAYVAAIIVACGASDALVPEDDPTYAGGGQQRRPPPRQQGRQPEREQERTQGRPPEREREQDRDHERQTSRRAAPIDPEAESNSRWLVLSAMLEKAGESGLGPLLDAWADLGEKDRVIVGKTFGTIRQAVEARSRER